MTDSTIAIEQLATIKRDIVYGDGAGVKLKMDLYLPRADAQVFPVFLFIHGDGWRDGDKTSKLCLTAELLTRGYAIASINYRLAPQHQFPAQIHDAKCAVRFLRAHAAHYRLDPNRIAASGTSAGAHLANLVGLTETVPEFEGVGGYGEQPTRVQAVVNMWSFTNLPRAFQIRSKVISEAFGVTSENDPILVKYSPVNYVTSNAPPFLIVHGVHDDVVEFSQGEELHKGLQKAVGQSTLIAVQNAGHTLTPVGGEISPTRPEIFLRVLGFLDENLTGSVN